MNGNPVVFLEPVEDDLRLAIEFYDSWRGDGGAEFLKRFRETIDWIEWNPRMFLEPFRPFRRAIIRKSYYGVFFACESNQSVEVAVLDLRRDPETIQELLKRRRR